MERRFRLCFQRGNAVSRRVSGCWEGSPSPGCRGVRPCGGTTRCRRRRRKPPSGMARKKEFSAIWLAWAAMARRFASRWDDTSIAVVSSSSGRPIWSSMVDDVGKLAEVSEVELGGPGHQPAEMVPVQRRLVDPIHPGHLGRPHPDPVDLDVVGVAVVAVLVVDGEGVGPFLGQDAGQAGRRFVDRRLPEAGRDPRSPSYRSCRSRGTRGSPPGPRRGWRPPRPAPSACRSPSVSPGARKPSATSPTSPAVAVTSTTRWPASAARHGAAAGDGLVVGVGVEETRVATAPSDYAAVNRPTADTSGTGRRPGRRASPTRAPASS